MRLNRGTLILVLVLVFGIVALVVFNAISSNSSTPGGTATPTNAQATARLFADVDPAGVTRVEVRRPVDGQYVVLTRNDQMIWTVPEGTNFNPDRVVDQTLAVNAINNVSNLTSSDRFPSNNDLATFGLDAPEYNITLTLADGTTRTLRVGNQSARASFYTLLNEDASTIVVVPLNAITTVTGLITIPPYVPQPTGLPTPTPTPDASIAFFPTLTPDQLNLLEIRDNVAGTLTRLERVSPFEWRIAEATGDPAPLIPGAADPLTDQTGATLAATNFTSLRYAGTFTSADVVNFNLADYGLTTPRYTIRAVTATGYQYTLHIGGLNPAGNRYFATLEQQQLPPSPTPTPSPTATATTAALSTPEATVEALLDATAEATAAVTAAPKRAPEMAQATAEPTTEPTVEPTTAPTATATTAAAEPTVEATVEATAEGTAEPTATTAPVITIYLIPVEQVDALAGLIAAPPFAVATATPTAQPTAAGTAEATAETGVTPAAATPAANVTATPTPAP